MKNITFAADEKLIEAAREQASADGSTLNEQFRLWLAHTPPSGARRRQWKWCSASASVWTSAAAASPATT